MALEPDTKIKELPVNIRSIRFVENFDFGLYRKARSIEREKRVTCRSTLNRLMVTILIPVVCPGGQGVCRGVA